MHKKNILVIEDDRDMQMTLREALEREGYQTRGAQDGEEGLDVALSYHPELIILDLIMPKMDGIEMLKRLRGDAWGKTVPVVILTNKSGADDAAEALENDVYQFLVKANWGIDEVVKQVKYRLASERR